MKESLAASEAVTFGAETLGVAAFAVDVAVGGVATQDRVERPLATLAAEAPLVVHAVLGEHLLGVKDSAAATRATRLSGCGLDCRRVHGFGETGLTFGKVAAEQGGTRLAEAVAFQPVPFPVTS